MKFGSNEEYIHPPVFGLLLVRFRANEMVSLLNAMCFTQFKCSLEHLDFTFEESSRICGNATISCTRFMNKICNLYYCNLY